MSAAAPFEITVDNATNWEESIRLEPSKVAHARTVDDIVAVVTRPGDYPSPVRATGSRHSTTRCGVSDGGTLLVMRRMDRILDIDAENGTVTAEAGALYIDVAKALEARGLQFFVNVEIGNLTMGSAACTGTKDASMPGEFGQVCSYVTRIKMVLANGARAEVTEDQPELMQAMRSSYGLLGVIYEVTFRVRPLAAMAVHHKSYTLDEFEKALPALRREGDSIMYYMMPFDDSLTVEFRRYLAGTAPGSRWVWAVRNYVWKTLGPALAHLATRFIGNHRLRYFLLDGFFRITQVVMARLLKSERTYASDQLIRYPDRKGISKYTFSIWAFPEQDIMSTMRAYYAFCQNYYKEHGFRCDMPNVGYRIEEDTNPLFSYSYDGTVMTLDPVCTASEPGWDEFLRAYNEFCRAHGGRPLFNQSKWLTRAQVASAFGERVQTFEAYRREYDPENRFLNRYFRELFV